jgi:hypothetical protein
MQLKCFDPAVPLEQLDRAAFKFKHGLLGHPALTLENLARVLPTLPPRNVMYSARLLANGDDFEGTFKQRPMDQSLEATIESIRHSDSYILVNSPETDPSIAPLFSDLLHDVEALMRVRGAGTRAWDPRLFLFIASPNSVTPFHLDRYSTFLLQFRGSKQICVFPQWDERVVSHASREAYMAHAKTQLAWSDEREALGTAFSFSPGEALHIPFAAGHHVRNGPEDVSISLSIIFNTPQTRDWVLAHRWNHWARTRLRGLGYVPSPVPRGAWRDACKSVAWRAVAKAQSLVASR